MLDINLNILITEFSGYKDDGICIIFLLLFVFILIVLSFVHTFLQTSFYHQIYSFISYKTLDMISFRYKFCLGFVFSEFCFSKYISIEAQTLDNLSCETISTHSHDNKQKINK